MEEEIGLRLAADHIYTNTAITVLLSYWLHLSPQRPTSFSAGTKALPGQKCKSAAIQSLLPTLSSSQSLSHKLLSCMDIISMMFLMRMVEVENLVFLWNLILVTCMSRSASWLKLLEIPIPTTNFGLLVPPPASSAKKYPTSAEKEKANVLMEKPLKKWW